MRHLFRVVINCSMDGQNMLIMKQSNKVVHYNTSNTKIKYSEIDERFYWNRTIN